MDTVGTLIYLLLLASITLGSKISGMLAPGYSVAESKDLIRAPLCS